jgi:hypothetical protein
MMPSGGKQLYPYVGLICPRGFCAIVQSHMRRLHYIACISSRDADIVHVLPTALVRSNSQATDLQYTVHWKHAQRTKNTMLKRTRKVFDRQLQHPMSAASMCRADGRWMQIFGPPADFQWLSSTLFQQSIDVVRKTIAKIVPGLF